MTTEPSCAPLSADQADDLGKGLLPERPESLDFLTLPDDPERCNIAISEWFELTP